MKMILKWVSDEIDVAIRLAGCKNARAAYAFVVQQYIPDPKQVVCDTTQALRLLKYKPGAVGFISTFYGMTEYLNLHRKYALNFRMIHFPYPNSLMAENIFSGLPDTYAEWILSYKLTHVLGSKSAEYNVDHLARCLLDEEYRLKRLEEEHRLQKLEEEHRLKKLEEERRLGKFDEEHRLKKLKEEQCLKSSS